MKKDKNKQKNTNEKYRTTIGGQALIEGILMHGPEKQSIVVRGPEGLVVKTEELKLKTTKKSIFRLPFIRGITIFGASMVNGVKALLYSAEFYPEDEPSEPSRFEKWMERKFGSEKLEKAVIYFSAFLGILMSVGMFILLPTFLTGLIPGLEGRFFLRNVLEGLVKIALFMGYMILVSQMKDMKRVFSYHGAEHKTIRCYEAKLPLTVENVRPMTRKHPRCGTSFLMVVICISILLGAVIRVDNTLARMAIHLLLLLPIVAISYEFNRWVGRHDNCVTRVLTAPGQWMQNFTTFEPDDSMIEVAITALKEVLPEQEGDDKW